MHACMLGGAIGDSLGADIEFLSLAEIRRRFPEGINEIPPHHGVAGAITDDTQMTLFTLEGLIRAKVRWDLKGICHIPSVIHHAMLRWYETQGQRTKVPIDRETGLIADKRLHAVRAPGNTCLSSLGAAQKFGDKAHNDSKGCGTIMRVAPIAFLRNPGIVCDIAIETSALTHGHPTGRIAAAAWAKLLAAVIKGEELQEAATRLAGEYRKRPGGTETANAIADALHAPRDGSPETVETLGGGWVAEEALAIALYAALSTSGFDSAIKCAIMHGGDSDSTGAIAGNLLGLLYPDEVLSHPWTSEIECDDLIEQLVADFLELYSGEKSAEDLWDTYPGW